jgi:DNA invertase Pin-like site-specific DNA recombinase
MKVIGYVAISPDGKEKADVPLDVQRNMIEKFCKENSYEIHSIYQDIRKWDSEPESRNGFMDALNIIRKGDILIIAKRNCLALGSKMTLMQGMIHDKKAKIISTEGEGTGVDQEDVSQFMMAGMIDILGEFNQREFEYRKEKGW